jgi:hypothetical protein
MKNFFRKDLDLSKKWWHRLLVVFFFSILAFISFQIFNWAAEYAKGYSKQQNISEYINDDIQSLSKLPLNNKNYARYVISRSNPYKEKNDIYFENYKDIAFCSNKLVNNLDNLLVQNGGIEKWDFYSGEMLDRKKLSLNEFKQYLKIENIKCVALDSYTGRYSESVPMVVVYTSIKDLSFYEFSTLKTFGNVLYYVFIDAYFVWLGALFIIILYYKVVLYIIFGSKKLK